MGWHDEPISDLYAKLGTGPGGLSSAEADGRLDEYGPNVVETGERYGLLAIIKNQFRSYIFIIPVFACLIALIAGEYHDAVVIFIIVLLNTMVGTIQEAGAMRSIKALKRMYRLDAHAMRNGIVGDVSVTDLVPGDIVMIKAGDSVPADVRIISSDNLSVDESMLTGEQVPREKHAGADLENAPIFARTGVLYMGTSLLDGECASLVVATGKNTEMGRISGLMSAAKKPAAPLEKALDRLGRSFGMAVVIIAVLIFIVGVVRGQPLYAMFLAAISVAVAAVPEGLAATITIALSTGARRMAASKAIVRSLPVVETLGSTSVICTDKTGTLTKNEASVKSIATIRGISSADPAREVKDPDVRQLFEIAGVCNDAIEETNNGVKYHGNQVDVALFNFLSKAGLPKSGYDRAFPRIAGIPFRPAVKMMVVLAGGENRRLFVKGAPGQVLAASSRKLSHGVISMLDESDRHHFSSLNESMASDALRVIAFGYRDLHSDENGDPIDLAHDLIFTGLAGFEDPPREGVGKAISTCKDAGIDIVMMTGDQRLTAEAVASNLDLFHEGDMIMNGDELDNIDDQDLRTKVRKTAVFARVLPSQKIRIVEAIQSNGDIVAVTGDGVNDSPALKLADVGIAMGSSGTEVAKEASDIILQDDNFATIVDAVREGRVIFDNIKKFVKYLFTSNVGEVATIFVGLLLGLPLPLLATQILWLNLITDGLPALALSVDAPEPGIMKRSPRKSGEGIVNRLMILDMILTGFLMCACTLFVFYHELPSGIEHARTMAFTTLVALHIANAFNCRSETRPAYSRLLSNPYLILAVILSLILLLGMIYVPFLQGVFYTVPLTLRDWSISLAMAPAVIIVMEIRKIVTNRFLIK